MITNQPKPTVHIGNTQISFTYYQLCQAAFCLKIMAKGMKMRGVNLKSIRLALNLKSTKVDGALIEVQQMIEDYKNNVAPLVSNPPQN